VHICSGAVVEVADCKSEGCGFENGSTEVQSSCSIEQGLRLSDKINSFYTLGLYLGTLVAKWFSFVTKNQHLKGPMILTNLKNTVYLYKLDEEIFTIESNLWSLQTPNHVQLGVYCYILMSS
jgi:hypothetical protein